MIENYGESILQLQEHGRYSQPKMVGTVHEFCGRRGVGVSVRYSGLQETYHGFIHVFCPFYFANFRNLPLFSKASPGNL